MCLGLCHCFDPTGDGWPQTAGGNGKPSDWRSWKKVYKEGGWHQRTERTGQSHRRPQVRFSLGFLMIILTDSAHDEMSSIICYFFNHRKLGASEGTINQEIQRYQQLESVAVNDIRRDVRKKLRRSSMRVNLITLPSLTNISILIHLADHRVPSSPLLSPRELGRRFNIHFEIISHN